MNSFFKTTLYSIGREKTVESLVATGQRYALLLFITLYVGVAIADFTHVRILYQPDLCSSRYRKMAARKVYVVGVGMTKVRLCAMQECQHLHARACSSKNPVVGRTLTILIWPRKLVGACVHCKYTFIVPPTPPCFLSQLRRH